MYENDHGPRELVSYWTLRKAVGVMGVLLPILLVARSCLFGAGVGLEDSISDYYGTESRDVLVGVLFVIAWFLFAYRGFDRKDDIAGDLACLFAVGVALFPTTSVNGVTRAVHLVCAGALFLVLAFFSLVLFRKTDDKKTQTDRKKTRNKVYLVCGVLMLVFIGLIPVYYWLLADTAVAKLKPVFWLESFALWAFGFAWMTKGEFFWADQPAVD